MNIYEKMQSLKNNELQTTTPWFLSWLVLMYDKIRKLLDNNIFNNSNTQTFSHKSCCKTHLGICLVITLMLEITDF